MQKYTITDTATGEEINVKYLPGSPKQYRFNGQTGQFNLNGETPILDEKGKPVQFIEITPLAFKIFKENLFGRTKIEDWAELFFVDSSNCLSSIMFNNSSVGRLMNLVEELFYEDLNLTMVKLKITPEKKESEKNGEKLKYYIIGIEYETLSIEQVEENKKFSENVQIWRRDTFTETAEIILFENCFMPEVKEKLLEETV